MKIKTIITEFFIVLSVLFDKVSSTPQKHKASDGREYIIETDLKYNWLQALDECARRDSQLVIIDSPQKNSAIIELLQKDIRKSRNLWIGGNSGTELHRLFHWSATGQRIESGYWSEKSLNSNQNQERCLHIGSDNPDFKWNDDECTKTFGFICEENHYVEKYENALQRECVLAEQTVNLIANDFNHTYLRQLKEMNRALETFYSLEDTFGVELDKLQKTGEIDLQQIIELQQIQIGKIFEEISFLGADFIDLTSEAHRIFQKKLDLDINKITKTC